MRTVSLERRSMHMFILKAEELEEELQWQREGAAAVERGPSADSVL